VPSTKVTGHFRGLSHLHVIDIFPKQLQIELQLFDFAVKELDLELISLLLLDLLVVSAFEVLQLIVLLFGEGFVKLVSEFLDFVAAVGHFLVDLLVLLVLSLLDVFSGLLFGFQSP
jgi:hypothetical protein